MFQVISVYSFGYIETIGVKLGIWDLLIPIEIGLFGHVATIAIIGEAHGGSIIPDLLMMLLIEMKVHKLIIEGVESLQAFEVT